MTPSLQLENRALALSFGLGITTYQFPKSRAKWDKDWLNAEVYCRYRDRTHLIEKPILLAGELATLSQWFDTVAKGKLPEWVTQSFIEPELSFQVVRRMDHGVCILVRLSHAIKPRFTIEELPDDETCTLAFEPSHKEMAQHAESLMEMSRAFPKR